MDIKIPVIIDTREQNPFYFTSYPCDVIRDKLDTGDYSIPYQSIIIERKSLSDLSGCMTYGRERFEKELERMHEFESAVVIVEEPLAHITSGIYRSSLKPQSFEQGILSFTVRYKVPFLFGHNRQHAEWLAFNCLRHYWNNVTDPKKKIGYIDFPNK